MSKKTFLQGVTAASLSLAVFVSSSMMALAGAPGKAAMGELTVTGGAEVVVNGEAANTGRTIFSSNTIATPANAGAIINLGKLGQIELAPNSSFVLNFDEAGISGTLVSGRVKVSGAEAVAASVNTKTGTVVADSAQAKTFAVSFDGAKTGVINEAGVVTLNESGKSTKVPQTNDPNASSGGFFNTNTAIIFTIVFGAAAGVILYTALDDSNDITLGGNTVVTSPTR